MRCSPSLLNVAIPVLLLHVVSFSLCAQQENPAPIESLERATEQESPERPGPERRLSQQGDRDRGNYRARGVPQEWRENRFTGRERPAERGERPFRSESVINGFLIVNGRSVDAPYEIVWDGENITCNDQILQVDLSLMGPRRMAEVLEAEEMLVLQGSQVKQLTSQSNEGMELLRFLADPNYDSASLSRLVESMEPQIDSEDLAQVFPAMDISPATRARAIERLALLEKLEASNNASILANSRLNNFAYPLTILGMLLTVFAFGHLISYPPQQFAATASINSNPLALRMVARSVYFVVLLSALDLVWTIMAWQAGQMKELNPIASQFIDDPFRLIVFKSIATVTGAGLLLLLRQYRPAQLASWWMCLVCTVLAFRWLTFNSMMIG